MNNNKQKLSKDKRFVIATTVLCLLLGFLVAIQAKNNVMDDQDFAETKRLNELVMLLKETKIRNHDLEKQLSVVKSQINSIEEGHSISISNPQLKKIYAAAGLTSIVGDGIVINIKESGDTNARTRVVADDSFIHSEDILKIINELKSSGASAIAINQQRIVTTSEVVTAGNAVIVNQSKLIPPYKISAVGPVDTMISAIKMRGGIAEYLDFFGIELNIVPKKNIKIPAFSKSL